jgi:hypothetical protein
MPFWIWLQTTFKGWYGWVTNRQLVYVKMDTLTKIHVRLVRTVWNPFEPDQQRLVKIGKRLLPIHSDGTVQELSLVHYGMSKYHGKTASPVPIASMGMGTKPVGRWMYVDVSRRALMVLRGEDAPD